MARARNFKPDVLLDENLAACAMAARWLFVGMWTIADRAGRLEDRPKRIKAAVLPHDSLDVEPLLTQLTEQGLILCISAIVDACYRLIVDGVSAPSWTRGECAQARGSIYLNRPRSA
jgi:hypothetical protein